MITTEEWMDLLSYRQMVAAGASWAEIARLAGCDWSCPDTVATYGLTGARACRFSASILSYSAGER